MNKNRELTTFKAYHASGLYINPPDALTASSLLFKEIYLPGSFSIIKEIVEKYTIANDPVRSDIVLPIRIFSEIQENRDEDVLKFIEIEGSKEGCFSDMTDIQVKNVYKYLRCCYLFALNNRVLFKENVLTTAVFESNDPVNIEKNPKPSSDGSDTYIASPNDMKIIDSGFTDDMFKSMVSEEDYIPLVTNRHKPESLNDIFYESDAKQIASILSMESIKLAFPSTKAVHPELILEARDKLSDQLPQFWSSMFALTKELRSRVKDCVNYDEIYREATFMVDTEVRPSLIDLVNKLEMDRKNWFYKILSPLNRGIKIMLGNPPVSSHQLLINSVLIGSDLFSVGSKAISDYSNLRKQAGLTYVLDLSNHFNK